METIVGLLLILLPAIFKLVEKKLNASGKTQAAEQVHDWSELFAEDKDDLGEKEDQEKGEYAIPASPVFPQPVVPIHEPVRPEPVKPKPLRVKAKKTSSKPMLVEEEQKKKEKIDPKKLVIYSEIMKPKF